jgi:hypothetical protein
MLGGTTGLTGTAGISTGAYGGTTAAVGASSIGVLRAPTYAAVPDFPVPTAAAPVVTSGPLVGELQSVLARSSRLSPNDAIQVGVAEGGVVVLQGTVADPHDRRIAEGMIRLSPGVRDVRNELQVRGTLPPPTRVP